ncbi:MAG TPA: DUF2520 domain-containing protein [Candidatus Sulfotelmatobacter sp.]|nr:DUF2520 domain-containing protein [Candidatus Sulfotelmatobacter sp.]
MVPSRETLPQVEDGIVFIAVPDSAVAALAKEMSHTAMPSDTSFVHVSGSLGLDVLAVLGGHAVGSFHPLQSFPAPRPPEAFQGITVAVDASTTGLERRLAQLARDIGARPRHVADEERVLYHAAAVFASNYVVAVIAEAVKILGKAGWSRDEAEQALLPLVEGVVANVRGAGVTKALTGPIRRGDLETVRRHMEALGEQGDLYRMLGLVALEVAKEAGLEPAAAEQTRRALTRNVAATRRRGRS